MPGFDVLIAAPPARPEFRDGQVLRATDLRDETEANVAAARRHQQVAHLPGIVAGLWLSLRDIPDQKQTFVVVSPGMAVDGAGRTLLLANEALQPVDTTLTELWIANTEDEQLTDPFAEGYELLFHEPGRFDPARSQDHPQQAVFLGTLGIEKKVRHAGRVYVGAVGARVVAASGQARLLLGPEGPSDLRLFAVGTRGASRKEYVDHIAVEASRAIRVNSPSNIDTPDVQKGLAAVVVGHRPVDVGADDVLDPVGLLRSVKQIDTIWKETGEHEVALLTEGTGNDRLKVLLARLLNRIIAGSDKDKVGGLAEAIRNAGVSLRPQTVRLLLNQEARTPRADPNRLARLLLEDAFPNCLKRLRDEYDGERGVAFVGSRPEPKAALPAHTYLTAVEDKTGPRRELRIEMRHPGKDNTPERFKVVVGTVQPKAEDAARTFCDPCLTADAAGTVTIAGDLRVYTDASRSEVGLILEVKGESGADDAGATADQLGQVAPWDLVIKSLAATWVKETKTVSIQGTMENTGKAPIIGVQVHAVVFATNDTKPDPIRKPLVRNLVVEPGKVAAIVDPPTEQAFVIPVAKILEGNPVPTALSVIVMVIGVGPGNVIASDQRRLDIT